MEARAILVVVLIVIALIIMIQNTGVVALHLLLWNITMSLILLIFLSLLVGFVIGYAMGKGFRIRKAS